VDSFFFQVRTSPFPMASCVLFSLPRKKVPPHPPPFLGTGTKTDVFFFPWLEVNGPRFLLVTIYPSQPPGPHLPPPSTLSRRKRTYIPLRMGLRALFSGWSPLRQQSGPFVFFVPPPITISAGGASFFTTAWIPFVELSSSLVWKRKEV